MSFFKYRDFRLISENMAAYGQFWISCNDTNFEIKDDSACKRFDLNDLSWTLGLSKKAYKLLAWRLNEKHMLEKVSYFWSRESGYLQYT